MTTMKETKSSNNSPQKLPVCYTPRWAISGSSPGLLLCAFAATTSICKQVIKRGHASTRTTVKSHLTRFRDTTVHQSLSITEADWNRTIENRLADFWCFFFQKNNLKIKLYQKPYVRFTCHKIRPPLHNLIFLLLVPSEPLLLWKY